MRHLHIEGKEIVVDERNYLSMLLTLAQATFNLAALYHNLHQSGLPDWKGTLQVLEVRQGDLNHALIDQIDDKELHDAFCILTNLLGKIKEENENLLQWLVEYVGLSSIRTKHDKAQFERRLKKIISGANKQSQGPVWVLQSDYQTLLGRSEKVVDNMSKIKLKIDQKIHFLLKNLSGD